MTADSPADIAPAAAPPAAASRATEAMLRRLVRGAVVFCLGTAALLLALTGNWQMGLGVIGGGLLAGISLLAIRSSVDAMVGVLTSDGDSGRAAARRRVVGAFLRLVGRYALLALMAYVMIARLRLHPIGLLIGASSLVASAALEAVRVLTRARTF